jgi:hypothetical protein
MFLRGRAGKRGRGKGESGVILPYSLHVRIFVWREKLNAAVAKQIES